MIVLRQVRQGVLQLVGVLRAVVLAAGGGGDLLQRVLVDDQRAAPAEPAAHRRRTAAAEAAAAAETAGPVPSCELSQTSGAGVVVPKPMV